MESLASARPTIEHQYASLLFSIDGLTHQFLQGIEAGVIDEAGDFSLSKEAFVEYRMSWIESKWRNKIIGFISSNISPNQTY